MLLAHNSTEGVARLLTAYAGRRQFGAATHDRLRRGKDLFALDRCRAIFALKADYSSTAERQDSERRAQMRVTQKVKKILDWYEGDPPSVKANLARIVSTGKIDGTGKVLSRLVDQGFEHGPTCTFARNPPVYEPHHYHHRHHQAMVVTAAPSNREGYASTVANITARSVPRRTDHAILGSLSSCKETRAMSLP